VTFPGSGRLLKKHEILASSFDKLRMRLRVFNDLDLMVSLSRFGGLTVRPCAASLFQQPANLMLRANFNSMTWGDLRRYL
jgi:hypothetical protein